MAPFNLSTSARLIIINILFVLFSGCATTQDGVKNDDPIESTNRVFFDVNETLDKHLLKPAAEAYVSVIPTPIRTGITNFFDNLGYLNVILNDFLQGKFNQGIADSLRFLYNSTLGIAGFFDVSTDIGIPGNDEDFGQTLAVWGMDKGSYLYLPFFGPNTARDTTNIPVGMLLNPLFYASGIVLFPINAVNAINTRANLLEASNIRDEAALDPYAFTREAYLQQREFLIYDGDPPLSGYDDIFDQEDDEQSILVIE